MSYQCFRPARSPYGIREPAIKPTSPSRTRPNWFVSLLKLNEVRHPLRPDGNRNFEDSANTVVRRQDDYRTKLAGVQTGPDSGPHPFPVYGLTFGVHWPWPQGTDFNEPADRRRKRDYSHMRPQNTRPIYRPVDAPYQALKSSTPGYAWDPSAREGATPRRDLVPIGGRQTMFTFHGKDVVRTVPSDAALGYGLDYGPAPWRVPYIRKSGLSLMAGPHQHSQQQQYSGVAGVGGPSGSILAAPPVWGDVTRGSRGVSGILQRVQGPGRSNVPGVFVPSEVR